MRCRSTGAGAVVPTISLFQICHKDYTTIGSASEELIGARDGRRWWESILEVGCDGAEREVDQTQKGISKLS